MALVFLVLNPQWGLCRPCVYDSRGWPKGINHSWEYTAFSESCIADIKSPSDESDDQTTNNKVWQHQYLLRGMNLYTLRFLNGPLFRAEKVHVYGVDNLLGIFSVQGKKAKQKVLGIYPHFSVPNVATFNTFPQAVLTPPPHKNLFLCYFVTIILLLFWIVI